MKNIELVFTIVPPPVEWDNIAIDRKAFEVANLLNSLHIGKVLIPEIIDEQNRGERVVPYKVKVDSRYFAKLISRYAKDTDFIISKVVPVMQKDRFREWIKDVSSSGFKHVLLVGGESSKIKYPGYSPVEAVSIAKEHVKHIYGITIFHRKNEPERLLRKTEAGMEAFFSQIVFDLKDVRKVLERYYELCSKHGLKPARIYISLAPISRKKDVEFLKWLGVKMDEDIELELLRDEKQIERKSIEILEELALDIAELEYDVGINMEHVMLNNLQVAGYTVYRIREVLGWKFGSQLMENIQEARNL